MLHLNPKRFFIELNFKKRNDSYTTPTNFSSKLCFQGSYLVGKSLDLLMGNYYNFFMLCNLNSEVKNNFLGEFRSKKLVKVPKY